MGTLSVILLVMFPQKPKHLLFCVPHQFCFFLDSFLLVASSFSLYLQRLLFTSWRVCSSAEPAAEHTVSQPSSRRGAPRDSLLDLSQLDWKLLITHYGWTTSADVAFSKQRAGVLKREHWRMGNLWSSPVCLACEAPAAVSACMHSQPFLWVSKFGGRTFRIPSS